MEFLSGLDAWMGARQGQPHHTLQMRRIKISAVVQRCVVASVHRSAVAVEPPGPVHDVHGLQPRHRDQTLQSRSEVGVKLILPLRVYALTLPPIEFVLRSVQTHISMRNCFEKRVCTLLNANLMDGRLRTYVFKGKKKKVGSCIALHLPKLESDQTMCVDHLLQVAVG